MQLIVEVEIECPFCGEVFPSVVDTSGGDYETIEDCSVCCRPISLRVRCQPGEVESVDATSA